MRKVAKQMLQKELVAAVVVWREHWHEEKSRVRGEGIMRRVGARMMKKELWEVVQRWREAQVVWSMQERGEGIMRRVGARMMKRELYEGFSEWAAKCKSGVLELWQNRARKLEEKLVDLRIKFTITTNVWDATATARC